jgi:protease I
MRDLHEMRIAILAVDGFEESELLEPKKALQDNGANVEVVSQKTGEIQGFKHHDKANMARVDRTFDTAVPSSYDGIMLPGGALNADQARIIPKVREFIQEMDRASKPIAAICHAPWELISAGILRGRTLTSWQTIQDDIRNAGGNWVDREFVLDRNLLTSRGPQDLPAFNREMVALFSRRPVGTGR